MKFSDKVNVAVVAIGEALDADGSTHSYEELFAICVAAAERFKRITISDHYAQMKERAAEGGEP